MIGSVATRKKNLPNFHAYYEDLCELHNVMPLRMITSQNRKDILDICADRIQFDELFPVTKALACDRSLCVIAIRSRCQGKYVYNFYGKRRSNGRHRPLIHTDFGMNVVTNAVKKCLLRTSVLTHLILEGLYFTKNNLTLLCTGLSRCLSIQNISFHQSFIGGDDGCQLICDTVKKLRNLHSLNISACNIAQNGGYCISQLLKYQQLERYSETWKEALRYRVVDVDRMPGIRRVTINNNTLLGDTGLMYLVECLKDDLWLKAIDLQNCGITNRGAQEIIKLLKVNTVLTVVDIRHNHDVSNDLLNAIKKQLAENNSRIIGDTQEYKWMPLDESLEEHSQFASSKAHPYFAYSYQKRSLHQKEESNAQAARSTSFWAQESCGSSYLPHQLKLELKQHETKIQELTEQLSKMHLEIEKVKEERDRYKKELQKMKTDYSNHILLNVDTVHAINDAFDKLTTYLKCGRNGKNGNT